MLGIATALLVASAAGCGKNSPSRASQPDTAATRLANVCKNATRELLNIDQHSLGSDPYLIGSMIEHAARKAEAVDRSTSASVRSLPNTPETAVTLGDLAHSDSQLRAIARTGRRYGAGHSGFSHGLLIGFLRANSGCGTVSLRNPTGG
jgi:hypothetical protein